MKTQTPTDLLFDQLRDLLSVEMQLLDSVPYLLEVATEPRLKEALANHLPDTARHAKTVAEILAAHEIKPGQDKCKAMEGLIEGGHAHIKAVDQKSTRDLMIVAHCLRIEHYEIAGYTIALSLAEALKFTDIAASLNIILKEENTAKTELIELQPLLFLIASSDATA